ncbi:hypothetical protein [Streptomyces sp. NPDC003393]
MPWEPILFATVIIFGWEHTVVAWFVKRISAKSFMPFAGYGVAPGSSSRHW